MIWSVRELFILYGIKRIHKTLDMTWYKTEAFDGLG